MVTTFDEAFPNYVSVCNIEMSSLWK